MKTRLFGWQWIILSLLSGAPATAATIKVDYSGWVSTIGSESFFGFQQIGVKVGDRFTASFTFDSDAVDLIPDDPTRGQYQNAILSYEFSVGVWSVSDSSAQCCSLVWVTDRDDGNDSWEWSVTPDNPPADSPSVLGSVVDIEFNLFNVASMLEPLSSDSIVLPSGLDDWERTRAELRASGGGATRLHLTPDTLTVIPIPPARWLFGSGLLGLLSLAKHRIKV